MKATALRLNLLLLATLALATSGGCRGNSVEVKGLVKLDGRPLSDVRVVFEPIRDSVASEGEAMGAYGVTNQEGTYQLHLVENNDEAIPVGTYRVRLLTFGQNADLPPEASDGSRIVTLAAGGIHEERFELVSPARRTQSTSPYNQLTTGKEPIVTKRTIRPRKTENDHLPSRKQPGE